MNQLSNFLSHVSNDTVFATITTLFVMILGAFSKWAYDTIKLATGRRYLRNYFLHYLRSLVVAVDKRVQSLKTVAEQAKIHAKDFAFVEVSVRSEHAAQLPHTDLFAALVRGLPSKKKERLVVYNELMDALDFLTRQVPIHKDQFLYFFENHKEYAESWEQNANSLLQLHRQFLADDHEKDIRPSADPFLSEINKILKNWFDKSNRDDPEVMKAELVEPLKTVCIKYQKDSRRIALLSHIIEAESAYSNRMRILQLTVAYFTEQSEATLSRKMTIEKSIYTFS